MENTFTLKKLLLLAAVLALTGCAGSPASDQMASVMRSPVLLNVDLPVKKLVITSGNENRQFDVEVASTDAQRRTGLMNRKSMDDNRGMLFLFDKQGYMNFWMKNTLIPLDIIFIDQDGYIKYIAKNAQPCTATNDNNCMKYNSHFPVKTVLELKGGITEKLAIKAGDKVTWL